MMRSELTQVLHLELRRFLLALLGQLIDCDELIFVVVLKLLVPLCHQLIFLCHLIIHQLKSREFTHGKQFSLVFHANINV